MKINVAKSAGFCFGVRRALKIALGASQSGTRVEMLGDIVHNEEVVSELHKAGIKKVTRLRRGQQKTLLIRAHGASGETFRRALCLGYRIVDATCPMVKEIHKIARKAEEEGYVIIIIGDKRHDEVRGIIGQLKKRALVIEDSQDIPLSTIGRIDKAAVVVQSTQNLEKALTIVNILKHDIRELKFFNTICKPTRIKQAEIKEMPLHNEVMIIIGSKTSANTKRLYEISILRNERSYWIQNRKELNPRWFRGVKSVGIMAGASTPDYTTESVIERIRTLSKKAGKLAR